MLLEKSSLVPRPSLHIQKCIFFARAGGRPGYEAKRRGL